MADLRSAGRCPREFEPRTSHNSFFLNYFVLASGYGKILDADHV